MTTPSEWAQGVADNAAKLVTFATVLRSLRNTAVHHNGYTLTADEVDAVLFGVRALASGPSTNPPTTPVSSSETI